MGGRYRAGCLSVIVIRTSSRPSGSAHLHWASSWESAANASMTHGPGRRRTDVGSGNRAKKKAISDAVETAGLVSSTSDYRFGRMDQLLLAEPRPSAVLATKNAIGFIVGVISGISGISGIAGSEIALIVIALYYRMADASIDLTSVLGIMSILVR